MNAATAPGGALDGLTPPLDPANDAHRLAMLTTHRTALLSHVAAGADSAAVATALGAFDTDRDAAIAQYNTDRANAINSPAHAGATNQAFVNALNNALETAFGSTTGASPTPHITASLNAGRIVFNAGAGNNVRLNTTTPESNMALQRMGFVIQRNELPPDAPPGALGSVTNVNDFTSQFDLGISAITFLAGHGGLDPQTGGFDFDINGVNFSFIPGAMGQAGTFRVGSEIVDFGERSEPTLGQVMNAINRSDAGVRMSFSSASNRFTMESTGVGAAAGSVNFSGSLFQAIGFTEEVSIWTPDTSITAGGFYHHQTVLRTDVQTSTARDARISINNEVFYRANNNFTIDGLNIVISDPDAFRPVVNATGDLVPTQIQVHLQRDTEGTSTMIREFIEEFNDLIRSIRELTETRRARPAGGGRYMPLTEEQRAGMSEREIELWEAQAQQGILHRDDTLRRITNDLHRFMFEPVRLPDGREINLIQMGIRTSRDLNDFGTLEIVDENRFNYMLNNHMEDVMHLFTTQSDIHAIGPNANRGQRLQEAGLGQRINDIINWQLSTGGGIAERAGFGYTTLNNNALTRRIENEDRRIDEMIRVLQRREHRYFQIFGRLEAAMMQSHSQMMFFEQMMFM
jgi:flagellar capping protein FliD